MSIYPSNPTVSPSSSKLMSRSSALSAHFFSKNVVVFWCFLVKDHSQTSVAITPTHHYPLTLFIKVDFIVFCILLPLLLCQVGQAAAHCSYGVGVLLRNQRLQQVGPQHLTENVAKCTQKDKTKPLRLTQQAKAGHCWVLYTTAQGGPTHSLPWAGHSLVHLRL